MDGRDEAGEREDDEFVEGCEADPRIPTEVKGRYGFPIRSGMLVPGTDNKGAPVRSFAMPGREERERRREKHALCYEDGG